MCRIQLEDTMIDAVSKMSDGNPCSITAMMSIIAQHDEIDPQEEMVRATQLGLFSQVKLKQMAEDQSREVDLTADEWAELDKNVCDRLDKFKRAA